MSQELQYAVSQFLFHKSALCDARQWEAYLDLYDEDSLFHIPQWIDEHTYVQDPNQGLSYVYYEDRTGLEDRVFRIRTERSSATIPDTRTNHHISNIEVLEQDDKTVKLRFNWHTMSVRYNNTDHFCGTSFYTLDMTGEQPIIQDKKVVLKTDYVRHVLDVYHI